MYSGIRVGSLFQREKMCLESRPTTHETEYKVLLSRTSVLPGPVVGLEEKLFVQYVD